MAKPNEAQLKAPKSFQQLTYEALVALSDAAHDGDLSRALEAVAVLTDYALRDTEPEMDPAVLKAQLKEAQAAEPDLRSERRIASLQRKYDRQIERRGAHADAEARVPRTPTQPAPEAPKQ